MRRAPPGHAPRAPSACGGAFPFSVCVADGGGGCLPTLCGRRKGLRCRCIRCREVMGKDADPNAAILVERRYQARHQPYFVPSPAFSRPRPPAPQRAALPAAAALGGARRASLLSNVRVFDSVRLFERRRAGARRSSSRSRRRTATPSSASAASASPPAQGAPSPPCLLFSSSLSLPRSLLRPCSIPAEEPAASAASGAVRAGTLSLTLPVAPAATPAAPGPGCSNACAPRR